MDKLTDLELEIILCMSRGYTVAKMSEHTKYTESSLETVKSKLYKKIGVVNAPHAVGWAFRNGLIN